MRNKLNFRLFFFVVSFTLSGYSQTDLNLQPGIERWGIKTSADNFTSNDDAKPVPLKKLLLLPLLKKKYSSDEYSELLIPKKAGTLKEGDIISTKGYLHLVALERSGKEKRDGDYHIQISLDPEWGDSCFIVEIPYENFVSNPELKSLCRQNRSFIRKRLLRNENRDPSTGGNIMQHPVYVKVTGQLFYDATHAGQMSNPNQDKRQYRGKKGNSETPVHSYTAWEIHPVTKIEFAPKPK